MDTTPSTPAWKSWFRRHSDALSLTVFGLFFTVPGIAILLFLEPLSASRSAGIDSLAVVSPATVASQPVGARVLLEARIAPDAPERFRDFVAFRRLEYRGSKEEGARSRAQWKQLEVVAPVFVLGDGPDRIAIAAPGYDVSDELHSWRSTEDLEHTLFGTSTQEVRGFRRGDQVTADGVLEDGDHGRVIRVTCLAGVPSAAYRDALRGDTLTLRILGIIFSAGGGPITCLGLFRLFRRPKSAAHTG